MRNQKYSRFLESISKEQLVGILENLQEIYFRTDTEGFFLWVSPSTQSILGFEPEELIGKNLADIQTGRNNKEFRTRLKESKGKLYGYKVPLSHRFGGKVWVTANIHFVYAEGEPIGIEGTATPITSISETNKELFIEKERAHITLGSIAEGVITTDALGNIEFMNPAAEKLCGWKCHEAKGLQLNDVFRLKNEAGSPYHCNLESCCNVDTFPKVPKYLTLSRRDGNDFSIEYSTSPIINDEGIISGLVVVFRDVTKLIHMEAKLSWQATHDSLTGLSNRVEFEKNLTEILKSNDKTSYSLCYIDLDNFKTVNDTCGHLAGDELLKKVTFAMKSSLDRSSQLFRVGGDEFTILFKSSAAEAVIAAEKLLEAILNFNFRWEDRQYKIGASIGITDINNNTTDIKQVIKNADKACYTAKTSGGNRITIYTLELERKLIDTEWISKIKYALEKDTFLLYKQKGITLEHTPSFYSEIFIRMKDEFNEINSPGDFLPAAQRYRLTIEIDRYVIKKIFSLQQIENEIIGINLCSQSLFDPLMPGFILILANHFKIDTKRICFEINEKTAIEDIASTIQFIEKMKPHGFLFALDDIGKSNQYLGYLKSIPVDFFKIGSRFMKNIQTDPVDLQLVETIHHIALILGKKTIAEFVENEETLKKIANIGIEYAQGFHIASPQMMQSVH